MAPILSHPFRLTPAGFVATVEQSSDAADTEQIAVFALTRRGERPMVPGFGLTDPAFRRIDPGELVAGITAFGPPVTIVDIDTRPGATFGTLAVTVEYRH